MVKPLSFELQRGTPNDNWSTRRLVVAASPDVFAAALDQNDDLARAIADLRGLGHNSHKVAIDIDDGNERDYGLRFAIDAVTIGCARLRSPHKHQNKRAHFNNVNKVINSLVNVAASQTARIDPSHGQMFLDTFEASQEDNGASSISGRLCLPTTQLDDVRIGDIALVQMQATSRIIHFSAGKARAEATAALMDVRVDREDDSIILTQGGNSMFGTLGDSHPTSEGGVVTLVGNGVRGPVQPLLYIVGALAVNQVEMLI